MKAAFTLVELLVVLAVMAVLAAIAVPATSRMSQYAARTKAISNMRQIGVAAHLFASDHSMQLPGQPDESASQPDRWPKQFCEYLSPSDPRVFLDPTDPLTAKLPLSQVISNDANNTGYIYNGFDELASDRTPLTTIPLSRLDAPSQIVLLAQKAPGAKVFYVDPLLQTLQELLGVLNSKAYDEGAYYLYVDGSVRFAKQSEYSNQFWLVDKTLTLPQLPIPIPPLPLGSKAIIALR